MIDDKDYEFDIFTDNRNKLQKMIDSIKRFFNFKYRIYSWSYNHFKIPFNIKYFAQRAVRGYSSADLWDLDSYLQDVIVNSLKEFRIKKIGVPCCLYDYKGKLVKSYDVNNMEDSIIKYNNMIDEIIDGMKAKEKLHSFEYFNTPEEAELKIKFNKAMGLLTHNWDSLWW